MAQFRAVLGLLLVFLSGCDTTASIPVTSAGSAAESFGLMDRWAIQQGGRVEGCWQARATAAVRPLMKHCTGVSVCVQVLETERVGAFGWPNGHVFVTRGLVDRLDDPELAAAVAHELGHLLDVGKLKVIGKNSDRSDEANRPESDRHDPDREERADAAGLRLLRADGIPPHAMLSMLKKVKECSVLTPSDRLAFERRLRLLSVHIESD